MILLPYLWVLDDSGTGQKFCIVSLSAADTVLSTGSSELQGPGGRELSLIGLISEASLAFG